MIPFLGDYLRVSALGRYGRPFSGAAFHQVAPQSYLAQASVGLGNYQHWKDSTPWEIELAVTVDSGLFVDHRGDALEERFVSLALRYSAFTFETWNDLINQRLWSDLRRPPDTRSVLSVRSLVSLKVSGVHADRLT